MRKFAEPLRHQNGSEKIVRTYFKLIEEADMFDFFDDIYDEIAVYADGHEKPTGRKKKVTKRNAYGSPGNVEVLREEIY